MQACSQDAHARGTWLKQVPHTMTAWLEQVPHTMTACEQARQSLRMASTCASPSCWRVGDLLQLQLHLPRSQLEQMRPWLEQIRSQPGQIRSWLEHRIEGCAS